MDAPRQLDSIHTSDEAAARLRISTRNVIRLGRRHGLCSKVGTDYLFSEDDLLKLWSAIRVEPEDKSIFRAAVSSREPWYREDLTWLLSKPSTAADRRVLGILRWLNRQSEPKSHKQIERAGPPTIKLMIEEHFVVQCGENEVGDPLVLIADRGKEQLSIAERWARKRQARGAKAVWW